MFFSASYKEIPSNVQKLFSGWRFHFFIQVILSVWNLFFKETKNIEIIRKKFWAIRKVIPHFPPKLFLNPSTWNLCDPNSLCRKTASAWLFLRWNNSTLLSSQGNGIYPLEGAGFCLRWEKVNLRLISGYNFV